MLEKYSQGRVLKSTVRPLTCMLEEPLACILNTTPLAPASDPLWKIDNAAPVDGIVVLHVNPTGQVTGVGLGVTGVGLVVHVNPAGQLTDGGVTGVLVLHV